LDCEEEGSHKGSLPKKKGTSKEIRNYRTVHEWVGLNAMGETEGYCDRGFIRGGVLLGLTIIVEKCHY